MAEIQIFARHPAQISVLQPWMLDNGVLNRCAAFVILQKQQLLFTRRNGEIPYPGVEKFPAHQSAQFLLTHFQFPPCFFAALWGAAILWHVSACLSVISYGVAAA